MMTGPTLESLTQEMQSAMKSGDKLRVSVLRMLMATVKNARVDKGEELSEEEVLRLVAKEVDRREEAAQSFEAGGRLERAEGERAEAQVLRTYLPQPLSESELDEVVDQAIEETGASQPSDMGKVMKALMPRVAGRADGSLVAGKVKSKLSG